MKRPRVPVGRAGGSRHSTVPTVGPPRGPKRGLPPRSAPPAGPKSRRRQVARIVEEGEASLLDVVDNLLNSGVMLNADLVLALANVDLVYVRLSALICAADRLLPPDRAR